MAITYDDENIIKLIPGKLYSTSLKHLTFYSNNADKQCVLKSDHPYLLVKIQRSQTYELLGAHYGFLIGKIEYFRYMDGTELKFFKEVY